MKRLLIILFCISPLIALGQTPGNPTQVNNTNYYSFQNYVGAVQGFMLPQRDTNWTPSAPALVYRPADSSLYYWKWNKWQKVGGISSSNDTSFSLYLLKKDFIDSLNNNRQTITRRNDSLFLTFGGSVSMVPDSTVFPTWFAINDSGYIKKETDPVFTSSPAYTITTININNWQTAFNNASTHGDTLILTSITGGTNKIPLLVTQDTSNFRGTGRGFGIIKTGNAKVYGDTLAYTVDTTVIAYPTTVHDSTMSFGNSHNVSVSGNSTINVTGTTQTLSSNPTFSLSANNTQALWNANQIQGVGVSNVAPIAGQLLGFNGSTYAPISLNPGSGTVTAVGMANGYGTTATSNSSNPITAVGTFTVNIDTSKITNLRYADSALTTKLNIIDTATMLSPYTKKGSNISQFSNDAGYYKPADTTSTLGTKYYINSQGFQKALPTLQQVTYYGNTTISNMEIDNNWFRISTNTNNLLNNPFSFSSSLNFIGDSLPTVSGVPSYNSNLNTLIYNGNSINYPVSHISNTHNMIMVGTDISHKNYGLDFINSETGISVNNIDTINSYIGYNVLSPNIPSGSSIDSIFGLYIEPQYNPNIKNYYGIYESGNKDLNYFAGNMAIGVQPSSSYSFRVKSNSILNSGVRIDNLNYSLSPDSSSIPVGTDSLGNLVRYDTKNLVVNVMDFGAVGNGIKDDDSAIIQATAYLNNRGGGILQFGYPNKHQVFLDSLIVMYSNITYDLMGNTIKCPPIFDTLNAIFRTYNTLSSSYNNIKDSNTVIKNGTIDGGSTKQYAIWLINSHNCTISDVNIQNIYSGINLGWLDYDNFIINNKITMPLDSPLHKYPAGEIFGINLSSKVVDLYSGGELYPYIPQLPDSLCERNKIIGNTITNGSHAINGYGTWYNIISNNYFDRQSERSVILSASSNYNIIQGNIGKDFGSTFIHLSWYSDYNLIESNFGSTDYSNQEGDGIKMYYGCDHNLVIGNHISGASGAAYRVAAYSNYNTFSNNTADSSFIGMEMISALDSPYIYFPNQPTLHSNSFISNSTYSKVGILVKANNKSISNSIINSNVVNADSLGLSISEIDTGIVNHISFLTNTLYSPIEYSLPRGYAYFNKVWGNNMNDYSNNNLSIDSVHLNKPVDSVGNILTYNNGFINWRTPNELSNDIGFSGGLNTSAATSGQILQYNGTNWINWTPTYKLNSDSTTSTGYMSHQAYIDSTAGKLMADTTTTGLVHNILGSNWITVSGGTNTILSQDATITSKIDTSRTGNIPSKFYTDSLFSHAGTGSGTVTSVAATGANGIAITGSPITTSGTINISADTVSAIAGKGWANNTFLAKGSAVTSIVGVYPINITGTATIPYIHIDSTAGYGYVSHNALNDTLAGKIIVAKPTDSISLSNNLGNSDLIQNSANRYFNLAGGALNVVDTTAGNYANKRLSVSNNQTSIQAGAVSTVSNITLYSTNNSPSINMGLSGQDGGGNIINESLVFDSTGLSMHTNKLANDTVFRVNNKGDIISPPLSNTDSTAYLTANSAGKVMLSPLFTKKSASLSANGDSLYIDLPAINVRLTYKYFPTSGSDTTYLKAVSGTSTIAGTGLNSGAALTLTTTQLVYNSYPTAYGASTVGTIFMNSNHCYAIGIFSWANTPKTVYLYYQQMW